MATPFFPNINVATRVVVATMEENDPVLEFLRQPGRVVTKSHNSHVKNILANAVKEMVWDPKAQGYGIIPISSPQDSHVRVDATIWISTAPMGWDIDPSLKDGWYPNQPLGTLQNVGHPAFRPVVVLTPPPKTGGWREEEVSREELLGQHHRHRGEQRQQPEDQSQRRNLRPRQHQHQRQFQYQFQPARKRQRVSPANAEDTPKKQKRSSDHSSNWGTLAIKEESGSKDSLEQFIPSLSESGNKASGEDDVPSSMLDSALLEDADNSLFPGTDLERT
ncbi:hypothetical protein SLS62_011052 [Diatrype stigma]|uniref:Uncharacterized protein n=1 Tax=Diatrype stigma TaxID=117547 RepID=A0AAN9U8N2_9PEZI